MTKIKKMNKVVLITGAAKRIGKALSIAFHKAGYSILIHYHSSAGDAEVLCKQLNQIRENSAHCLACELDNKEALDSFVKECHEHINDLHLLINNASRFYPTPLASAKQDDWQHLMDSNLRAPYFLCQGFLDLLTESKGNIINLVDIYGERPLAKHSLYSMSKAGLIMLNKSLALELAPAVRVNAIAPGAILWPEGGHDDQEAILQKVPLQREGNEQDIVDAALYLNSADYVTGQVIQVDGGRVLAI